MTSARWLYIVKNIGMIDYQCSSRNDRLYPTLHEIDAALTDIQSTGGNSSTEGLRSYIGRVNYTAFE